MSEGFNITNKTKAKLPSLAFEDMKDAVLGKEYDLSVVIVDKDEIHDLNMKYRGKDKPTDILSFPIDDLNGEIYINPECTAEEAKNFDREYENFFAFLFIHGLVHLKGHEHGVTMERIEERFRKMFGI